MRNSPSFKVSIASLSLSSSFFIIVFIAFNYTWIRIRCENVPVELVVNKSIYKIRIMPKTPAELASKPNSAPFLQRVLHCFPLNDWRNCNNQLLLGQTIPGNAKLGQSHPGLEGRLPPGQQLQWISALVVRGNAFSVLKIISATAGSQCSRTKYS